MSPRIAATNEATSTPILGLIAQRLIGEGQIGDEERETVKPMPASAAAPGMWPGRTPVGSGPTRARTASRVMSEIPAACDEQACNHAEGDRGAGRRRERLAAERHARVASAKIGTTR